MKPGELWWLPNVSILAAGLIMVGLGILDHDSQVLQDLGIALVSGAAGHWIGVQQPTPIAMRP